MPSTYSPDLAFELLETGANSGTWGTKTNNNLSPLIEEAIGGGATIAMADANQTIAMSNGVSCDARNLYLQTTGVLTAQRNLTVPTINKLYIVFNNTTGGFGVQVKTASGAGIVVENGATRILYVDGTNVVNGITAFNLATPLPASSGGTGVNNGSNTLSLNGGTFTFTASGNAAVTVPTTGTLITSDVATLSSLTSVGTLSTGTWNATTIDIAHGGTGVTTAPSNGKLLIGNNSSGYTVANLTAGSGVTITNGNGTITIAATNSGGTVTSVSGSGGSTGLTLTGGPITTSGTLTLGGTLAVANGGTGVTSSTGSGNVVLSTGATITGATLSGGSLLPDTIVIPLKTVATLPAQPFGAGAMYYVTDGAGALAWGASVTGGGSTKYLVWSNGADWTVVGK